MFLPCGLVLAWTCHFWSFYLASEGEHDAYDPSAAYAHDLWLTVERLWLVKR